MKKPLDHDLEHASLRGYEDVIGMNYSLLFETARTLVRNLKLISARLRIEAYCKRLFQRAVPRKSIAAAVVKMELVHSTR